MHFKHSKHAFKYNKIIFCDVFMALYRAMLPLILSVKSYNRIKSVDTSNSTDSFITFD